MTEWLQWGRSNRLRADANYFSRRKGRTYEASADSNSRIAPALSEEPCAWVNSAQIGQQIPVNRAGAEALSQKRHP